MDEIVIEQICSDCGKVRTNEPDYNFTQAIIGNGVGWYSGDDGDFCPDDMAKMLNQANEVSYYEPW